jgi:hypothetical protein
LAVVKAEYVDGYFVSRRLASVRIGNGTCSGTIVFIGEMHDSEVALGLTANHCGYDTGDVLTVEYVDGTKANARCIDVDADTDLMLFAVSAKSVLGVAPFSREVTTDDCYAVGFPGGKGPNEKSLEFRQSWMMGEKGTGRSFHRNQWYVKDGYHSNGDSGCGIFNGDRFVGVLTHGPSGGEPQAGSNLTVQSATHAQVASLLKRNRGKFRERHCKDGQCTDEGPRDLWWLKPNVDVAVPEKPIRNPEQIENPRRPDITGPFEQRKAIAELQAQVKALTKRVEALESGKPSQPPLPIIDDGLIDEAPPPPAVDYSSEFNSIRQLLKSNTNINYGPQFENLQALIAANKSRDYNADFAELKRLIAANAIPPVEQETVIRVKIYGDKFSPVDAIMTAKGNKVIVQVLDTMGRVVDEDNYAAGSLVRFKMIKDDSTVVATPAS